MNDGDRVRFIHDLWEFNSKENVDINNSNHIAQRGILDTYVQNKDVGRPYFEREPLVKIHFFCLMPNHYHLLLSPIDDDMKNLSLFMKKLNGGYSKYFNERYERTGALWQGKYKSVSIKSDAHFLYIPFYIHFNALDLKYPAWRTQCLAEPRKAIEYLKTYRWSSHLDYLGQKNFPSITDRSFFHEHFGGEKGYARNVGKMLKDVSVTNELDSATLE